MTANPLSASDWIAAILKKHLLAFSVLALCFPQATLAAQELTPPAATPPVLLLFPLFLLVVVCWFWFRLQRSQRENETIASHLQQAEQILDQAPLDLIWFDANLKIIQANQSALHSVKEQPLVGCDLLEIEPAMARHPIVVALQSREYGRSLPLDAPETSAYPTSPEQPGQKVLVLSTDDDAPVALWYRTPLPSLSPQAPAAAIPVEAVSPAVESASRMKSEFIANINHEIRTPMNAIIGYAEMLANAELPPREKRFVSIIHRSSMALVSIFNDIMELSKIDSGRMQIMASTIRLQSIVDEVEGFFRDTARDKALLFRCHIKPELPSLFIVDGVRLKQVLQNLVSNAIKFTPKGYVEMVVEGEPSLGHPGSYDLHFRVEDSGIGIPTADQKKIFELFQQCEDSISKHYGGVGLGLTLCSRLIAMMGGKIELFSREGEGARFTVSLPAIQVAEQAPSMKKPNISKMLPDRSKKILVVDDMDLIKDVFVDYFQDTAVTVLTANTGEEALLIAAEEKPGIIFMDLNLVGMDGRTVTEQLHNQTETAAIPVVVMTGEILEEADYKPLFDDFLQKPFRLDALKELINRYIPFSLSEEPPPIATEPANMENQALFLSLEAVWTEEFEELRQKASRSGSLSDAVTLGTAMLQAGEREHQPLLTDLGGELIQHAVEPNILGVDRLLAKLSRVAEQKLS
jgi:signal transduction histidine kinase/DNA-binding LytR/AlgR family response regulator